MINPKKTVPMASSPSTNEAYDGNFMGKSWINRGTLVRVPVEKN
jgi:hypothetical protein